MHRTSRPLTAEERKEIADWVASGLRGLTLEGGSGVNDELQGILRLVIDKFRRWDAAQREAKLEMTSLCIGCLWGQTICDQVGWEWAKVRLGADWEGYGIVSPTKSHVVFPLHFVRDLLSDPERDQTSRALYNLLKARKLPPSEPGALLVLR
jgi:hypothetical protein